MSRLRGYTMMEIMTKCKDLEGTDGANILKDKTVNEQQSEHGY